MNDNEKNCPVCTDDADRKLPKNDLTRLLCRTLSNPDIVTSDTFAIFDGLFDKWTTGKARYPHDNQIDALLQSEDLDDENMNHIKQSIIQFASATQSKALFRESVYRLAKYKDTDLQPHLQEWLNQTLREYLLVGSTMNSLLDALEACGETIRSEEHNKTSWESNSDAARIYLIDKMKIAA